jgi:broad specificity phosphatase PhoE
MNLWEMIVVVVVVGAIVKMYLARHGIVEDNQGNFQGNRVSIKDPDADRLREEVRMLKDRLAVLERIATDNNRAADLDREIDRLR